MRGAIDTPADNSIDADLTDNRTIRTSISAGQDKLDTPAEKGIEDKALNRVDGKLKSHPINAGSWRGLSRGGVVDSPNNDAITRSGSGE